MDLNAINRTAAAAAQPLIDLIPKQLTARLTAESWKTFIVPGVVGYLIIANSLRFRREKAELRKHHYPTRESLAKMTADEAQVIIRYLAGYEFPMMHYLALQFGLFKTYGVESISKMLLATRNLTDPVRSLKRYEDTSVLIAEFMIHPPSSERANRAISRMNFLHSKYTATGGISNEDLLYTLSVFVTEPIRFMALYEWRAMNDVERCAYGVFWKSIGDAMGIKYTGFLARDSWTDGLEFVDDITAWAKSYEVEKFKPSTVSNKPAIALMPMMTYWVPKPLKSFAKECLIVLMGDRVREAFMLPEPGLIPAVATYNALFLRRLVMRYIMLPRVFEQKRLGDPDPNTGRTRIVNQFGNYPYYAAPTLLNRWGPEGWFKWAAGAKVTGDEPEEYMPQGYLWTDIGPKNRMGHGADEMEANWKDLMAGQRGGCPFAV